jgi:hypothetical protein
LVEESDSREQADPDDEHNRTRQNGLVGAFLAPIGFKGAECASPQCDNLRQVPNESNSPSAHVRWRPIVILGRQNKSWNNAPGPGDDQCDR